MLAILSNLSKFENDKQFLDITHDGFVSFLDSFRKPETSIESPALMILSENIVLN